MISNKIFNFLILFLQFNSFTIHEITGTSLKECKIKFHNRDWKTIDDCDTNYFNEQSNELESTEYLNVAYNLGDKIDVWIKL